MLVAAKESLFDAGWYTEHGKCCVLIDCFLFVEENLYCSQVFIVFQVLHAHCYSQTDISEGTIRSHRSFKNVLEVTEKWCHHYIICLTANFKTLWGMCIERDNTRVVSDLWPLTALTANVLPLLKLRLINQCEAYLPKISIYIYIYFYFFMNKSLC